MTAPRSQCRLQDRAKEPGWEGGRAEPRQRAGRKEGRKRGSGYSRPFPSFPAHKDHFKPSTAPVQGSMYPNHPCDPTSSVWGHRWARDGVQRGQPLCLSVSCVPGQTFTLVSKWSCEARPWDTVTHLPPREAQGSFSVPQTPAEPAAQSSPSAPPAQLLTPDPVRLSRFRFRS